MNSGKNRGWSSLALIFVVLILIELDLAFAVSGIFNSCQVGFNSLSLSQKIFEKGCWYDIVMLFFGVLLSFHSFSTSKILICGKIKNNLWGFTSGFDVIIILCYIKKILSWLSALFGYAWNWTFKCVDSSCNALQESFPKSDFFTTFMWLDVSLRESGYFKGKLKLTDKAALKCGYYFLI